MKTIYASLPFKRIKAIEVTETTGTALRRALRDGFKELAGFKLPDITFDGFKKGRLEDSFYSNHDSESNPLIIRAKSQINNPLNDIRTFTSEGKLLELTRALKVSPTIFVRECYDELWKTFIKYEKSQEKLQVQHPERIAHAYLTGTPGIGKTAFLPYLIQKLLTEKRQVIFGSRDLDGFLYWESTDKHIFVQETEISTYLRNPDIFFLMDSRDIKSTFGPCIICSSPRSDIAGQFRKTAKTLYMPVWEWYEIQCLYSAVYHDVIPIDRLAARFYFLGGIPRYLFDHLDKTAAEILRTAINGANSLHLKSLYESKGNFAPEEISHRLVHQYSSSDTEPPFGQLCLQYASDYVSTLVAEKYQTDRHDAVIQWLSETSEIGIAGGLRGNLFENIAHLQLIQGIVAFYTRWRFYIS
jgi:GTPase SAR1 family protein